MGREFRKQLKDSDVTDYNDFITRKRFLKRGIAALGAIVIPSVYFSVTGCDKNRGQGSRPGQKKFEKNNLLENRSIIRNADYQPDEKLTAPEDATGYNNFYEFSTGKEKVAELAASFQSFPWKVQIDGEVEKKGNYHLEDLIKNEQLEERIYRFRCVEGWSMVVPWVGVSLASVLKRVVPTSKARYVEFTTLYDPEQMPGQKRSVLDWPYVEGLRLDEALHPLAFLAVGLYGKVMPNQNGAPVRLVVPWKYGFKSIKSIVKIRLTKEQPATTWSRLAPDEYGFYANVNPEVDHPRWSQKMERRLGSFSKIETLPFNGYQQEVAGLYNDLDLRRFF